MATCEDFPCCGHELNDCDGSKYGNKTVKDWQFAGRDGFDYGDDSVDDR
jgi:hypothetical protein